MACTMGKIHISEFWIAPFFYLRCNIKMGTFSFLHARRWRKTIYVLNALNQCAAHDAYAYAMRIEESQKGVARIRASQPDQIENTKDF